MMPSAPLTGMRSTLLWRGTRKFYHHVRATYWSIRDSNSFFQSLALRRWLKNGRPCPPPHIVKSRNLTAVADLFNLNILIETGTWRGNMIDATVDRFERIYSIEISKQLANKARRRF